MVFKKRIPVRALIRAVVVIFIFFGVPLWLFVAALILDLAALWVVLILWLSVCYYIAWRVENE